jgi:predicted DNA-binding transcriptional regulator AlpA
VGRPRVTAAQRRWSLPGRAEPAWWWHTSTIDAGLPGGAISTSSTQLVTAAEAARILGVTRSRVLVLTGSEPEFPPAEPAAAGGRRWPRAAIEAWAAAHPDRGPLHPGLEIGPIGQWPWQVQAVVDLAHDEARALHHHWVGEEHLWLALLHPDCPGAARAVLESLGVFAAPLREAWVASRGDPYEPHHRGILFSTGPQRVLERANLEALVLADAEVASEHVLLALTGRWDQSFAASWLRRCGIDPVALRRRVVEFTEGGQLPAPPPAAAAPMGPPLWDPASGLELAPTPDGKDPRRRRPWGSAVFADAESRTFRLGLALRQYFIDRDGNPVLTADGRPVHLLVDEHGQQVLDGEGRPRIGAVEIPPGCQVRAHHQRE